MRANKRDLIQKLISRLDQGNDVSRRLLTKAIGVTAMRKLDKEWRDEQKSRTFRPPEIVKYTSIANKGILMYTKAEVAFSKGSRCSSRLYRQSEVLFEEAILTIKDYLAAKPELCQWLDRPIDLNNLAVSLCPVGLPRAIWSTSPYKVKGSHLPQRRIRDLKREALEQALEKSDRRCSKSASLEIPAIIQSRRVNLDFSDFKF